MKNKEETKLRRLNENEETEENDVLIQEGTGSIIRLGRMGAGLTPKFLGVPVYRKIETTARH